MKCQTGLFLALSSFLLIAAIKTVYGIGGFSIGAVVSIVSYNGTYDISRPILVDGSDPIVSYPLTYYGSGYAVLRAPSNWNDAYNYTVLEDGNPLSTFFDGTYLNWTANQSRQPVLNFNIAAPRTQLNGSYFNGLLYIEDFSIISNNSLDIVTYNKTFNTSYLYWAIYAFNGSYWFDMSREYSLTWNYSEKWTSFTNFNLTEYANESFLLYGSNACLESWDCSAWGSCVNDLQTRTCIDYNNCGSTNFKPVESRACTSITSSGGGTSKSYAYPEPRNLTSYIYINLSENKTLKTTVLYFNESIHKAVLSYYVTDEDEVIDVYLNSIGETQILPEQFPLEFYGIEATKEVVDATFFIRVPRNWTKENNVDRDSIRLEYLRKDYWSYIRTNFEIEDADYIYYRTLRSDFLPSIVSITGQADLLEEVENETIKPDQNMSGNITRPPVEEGPQIVYKWRFPWYIIVIAAFAVVLAVLITHHFSAGQGDKATSSSTGGSSKSSGFFSSFGHRGRSYGSSDTSGGSKSDSGTLTRLVHKSAVEEGYTKHQVKEILASEGVDRKVLKNVMGKLKTHRIAQGAGSTLKFDEKMFLKTYVEDSLTKGFTSTQIREALEYAGYSSEVVDAAIEGKLFRKHTQKSRSKHRKEAHNEKESRKSSRSKS